MIRGGVLLLLLRPAAVGVMALALASCSGLPQLRVPPERTVPVPVPCVDAAKRPKPPAIVDTDALLAMDEGTRTLRTWAAFERLITYTAELEAVVEGCSRIPPAPAR